MPRRARTTRRLSGKAAAIALIAGILAAGAAYGAAGGFSGPTGGHRHEAPIAHVAAAKKRLPPPRITAHPDAQTTSTTAAFGLTGRARRAKLKCRLDADDWRTCGRTVTFASVETGSHRFSARTVRRGALSSRIASFTWTVEAPVVPIGPSGLAFEIAQSGPLPMLYPGAGP